MRFLCLALLVAMALPLPLWAAPTPGAAAIGTGCDALAGNVPAPGGEGRRAWEDDVPRGMAGGQLTVTARHGAVQVATWDRWAYRVEAPGHWWGTTVDGDTTGSRFHLRVTAQPGGSPVGAPVAAAPGDPVVTVWVPDTRFDRADVRGDGFGPAGVLVHGLQAGALDAVSRNGPAEVRGANASELSMEAAAVGLRLTGSHAGNATLTSPRGATCVADHRGHGLRVAADDDVTLRGADVANVTVRVGHGRILAHGLQVANLTLTVEEGSVDARATPVASGRFHVRAGQGSAALTVPTTPEHGYDVTVRAPHGPARHDVPGAQATETRDGAHLRTRGFDARPIRTWAVVESRSGDATVTGHGAPGGAAAPAGAVPAAAKAAGVGAVAAALLYALKGKLRLLAAALYSRIGRDDVLDHPARRELMAVISEDPGVHLGALQRRTGLARGTLEHHLGKLADTGLIAEETDAGYRCLFPTGAVDRRVMEVAGRLRTGNARRVLTTVIERPGLTVSGLAAETGLPVSSASYLVEKLADAGLLRKERAGRAVRAHATALGARAARDLDLR